MKYIFILLLGVFEPFCFGDNQEDRSSKVEESLKDWILSVPFQKISAGSFKMGSPENESGRGTDVDGNPAEDQVEVTISKPFEIMTTEVTQSQWVRVMDGENPSRFITPADCDDYDPENNMCPNHPVEKVF